MLPTLRRATWVKIRLRIRTRRTAQFARLFRALSPQAFRFPPNGLRGRAWRVLSLLAQYDAGTLDPHTCRELDGRFAEVDPTVDRIIAGQDRWGRSRQ